MRTLAPADLLLDDSDTARRHRVHDRFLDLVLDATRAEGSASPSPRAYFAGHGTGSRSQIRIDATSMVPGR